MNRRWRFGVYLLVALLSSSLLIKSRSIPDRKRAAFLRYTSGARLVKIAGCDDADGVYRIFDSAVGKNVNYLTISAVADHRPAGILVEQLPESGAVLECSGNKIRLSARKMTAAEYILLGVPLDTATMSTNDWESLPGIGPALAVEITRYSQKNGGIVSVEELIAVPGIGEGKVKRIRQLFK